MSTNHIIPLSPFARFLATQLSSATSTPNVVLPQHLMKSFLTAESKMTYINKISPTNQFNKIHHLPCSSLRHLERISRPLDVISDSKLKVSSTTSPMSLIIPASQITSILDPLHQESSLIPPSYSNLVILNPYYGQVEKFMNQITHNYDVDERPRVWSVASTHFLTNGPLWTVEHRSIGEVKIAYVPYEDSESDIDLIQLINDSRVVRDLLNTPTILPQMETYYQFNLLLVDQLIVEAALAPIMHDSYGHHFLNGFSADKLANHELGSLILKIIDEAIEVLSYDPLFNRLLDQCLAFNALLSSKRMFNKVMNILHNNRDIVNLHVNLNIQEDLIKLREGNREVNKKVSIEDRQSIVSRIRDPAKANRYIRKLGLKYNIKTPANSKIITLLTSEYYLKEKDKNFQR